MAGGSMYVIDSLRGSREDEIQTSQRFRRLLIAVVSACELTSLDRRFR